MNIGSTILSYICRLKLVINLVDLLLTQLLMLLVLEQFWVSFWCQPHPKPFLSIAWSYQRPSQTDVQRLISRSFVAAPNTNSKFSSKNNEWDCHTTASALFICILPAPPIWFSQIKHPPRPLKRERALCIILGAVAKVQMASLAHRPSSHCQLKSFCSPWTSLRMNIASDGWGVNDYHCHHHHQTVIWPLLSAVWFILLNYRVGFQSITRTRKTFTSLLLPPPDLGSAL